MNRSVLKYFYIVWFLSCTLSSAQTPSIDLQSKKEIIQIIAYNNETDVLDKITLEKKLEITTKVLTA
jgi:hypothetical protein